MANCLTCKKPVENKYTFEGMKYKNYTFCSHKCYQEYLEYRELNKTDVEKFTDVLQKYWTDPDYQYFQSQAENIMRDFHIDYATLREAIKYGIQYCYDIPQEDKPYGLYQYTKYIAPSQQFKTDCVNAFMNDEISADEITYIPKRQPYYPKEVKW